MLKGRPSTCSAITFASRRRHSARAADEAAMLRLSRDSSGVRRISKAIATMQSDDAAGEVVIATLLQSGFLHHLYQGLLLRKAANGLGQVSIAGFVASDEFAQPRQHGKRIRVVQRLQSRRDRM